MVKKINEEDKENINEEEEYTGTFRHPCMHHHTAYHIASQTIAACYQLSGTTSV